MLDDDGVHLLEGSPCVNTGDPDGDYTGQTDIDGEERVQACRVDMGVDETPYYRDCNNNGLPDACDIAGGTSEDCQPNVVPDECDIAEGTSQDANEDGIPDECQPASKRPMPEPCGEVCGALHDHCTVDDDCADQSRCVLPPVGEVGDGVCYAPKHRYISIARHAEQVPDTARRVSLQDGPVLGWVGEPFQNAGLWLADVIATPTYAGIDFTGDWPSLLHVTGCEIATHQVYLVQAIQLGEDLEQEGNYSEALVLHTPTKWGDVVGTCAGDVCKPPNGFACLDDIQAKIKKFQAVPVAPLTWLDDGPSNGSQLPNQVVNLNDIMITVTAFQGIPYPGDGPLGCP
jgi:hypothetical protein